MLISILLFLPQRFFFCYLVSSFLLLGYFHGAALFNTVYIYMSWVDF